MQILFQRLDIHLPHFSGDRIFPRDIADLHDTVVILLIIPERNGRKFIAERPSKIATLALGYADGYPRPYSQQGKVLVNGCIAPLAGNICMDQCMVDVTDVPDVKVGDEVIVMGSDGKNTILADDIARATGTISYEICCAFGQRLPKVYVK